MGNCRVKDRIRDEVGVELGFKGNRVIGRLGVVGRGLFGYGVGFSYIWYIFG